MEKKGEMTADFLKKEEEMKSMQEWRELVKDRPNRKYERTWMTQSSSFLKSPSK